jgi:hypothetical protein
MRSDKPLTPVQDLLIRARERIEKGWCQGAYAKNADGDVVGATDPYATSFCIRGAILAVGPLDYAVRAPAYGLLETVIDRISQSPCDSLAGYNDTYERTHAEVLAVFDAAIALADPTP